MSTPDFIERLNRGDRISAEQWNLRGDLHRRQEFGSTATIDPAGVFHRPLQETRDLVLMKNSTGANRARYEVAGVDNALYAPSSEAHEFKYRVGVTGITPSIPTHLGKWGVFQEDVDADQIGTVKLAGATQVQIDVQDESDQFAEAKNATCSELISNPDGGAKILWKETGTGVVWAIVRIEGSGVGETWYFTLAEELVQWTTPIVPVDAYRRIWDPSANAGWGGFTIDCTQAMLVGDYAWVGFKGMPGAQGWAEMRMSDNGLVGVIRGLNCPDACVCGTDYTETIPCAGT